jgi:ribosomal protein S15P/S13E
LSKIFLLISNINESLDERFKKKINVENSQRGWNEFAKKSPRIIKYYAKSTNRRDSKTIKKKQTKEPYQTIVRDIPAARSGELKYEY